MLVIISDLHFCDGTAYARNVEPAAFAMLLDEAYELAEKVRAETIDLVFLGDVFDFLRTERWFTLDPENVARPWSAPEALEGAAPSEAALGHARTILDEILAANADTFRVLRGEPAGDGVAKPRDPPATVRRIYIPGNHDRLFTWLDAGSRQKMLDALGARLPGDYPEYRGASEAANTHAVVAPEYGLVARHGHEWDAWNFAACDEHRLAGSYGADEYRRTPIGDPITTEIAARIPWEVARRLTPDFGKTAELGEVILRLQRIEDVRPLLSTLKWVDSETQRLHGWLQRRRQSGMAEALAEAVRQSAQLIAQEFLELPFYQHWMDGKGGEIGGAKALRSALALAASGGFTTAAKAVGLGHQLFAKYPWLSDLQLGKDPLVEGAKREVLTMTPGMNFVVYGHTHDALQLAMRTTPAPSLYLNSGTWRSRQFETVDGGSFIGWQQCTWLAFYSKDEVPAGSPRIVRVGPAFESWTGQRKILDHGELDPMEGGG